MKIAKQNKNKGLTSSPQKNKTEEFCKLKDKMPCMVFYVKNV